MILFEVLDRDEGVLSSWRLEPPDRARLNAMLDVLSRLSVEQASRAGYIRELPQLPGLSSTVRKKARQLRKLRVTGGVTLRPILVPGPDKRGAEVTFLATATERDGKLDPKSAVRRAVRRLEELRDGQRERREIRAGRQS